VRRVAKEGDAGLQAEEIEALFTRSDGAYLFARWGRPVVPAVFGAADESLPVIKGAFEAVITLAGHRMAESDPELGANLMVFFVRDWAELLSVPDLDRLVPGLADIVAWLGGGGGEPVPGLPLRSRRGDPGGLRLSADGREPGRDAGRGAGARPGGADDPSLVGPGLRRGLAPGACGRKGGPAARDRGGDPGGL